MLSKRGITQADWIISIGIFIIYLAWFFVVIRPVFEPATKESLPADSLKEKFMSNVSWQVNMTPIIILSSIDSEDEPMIIDFPFSGSPLNYMLKETYWDIMDGRLLFQADLNDGPRMYSLLHSSYNYTKPSVSVNMIAGDSGADSGGMSASFSDGILNNARYNNALKIIYLEMEVDGNPISTIKNDFSVEGIIAAYRIRDSKINNTYYIFDKKPRIYNYIDTEEQKTVTLKYTLQEYDSYYIDDMNEGAIRYNDTECDSFETDLIDFTKGSQGLAFLFDQETHVRMCHDANLEIEISADIDGSFGYFIMFHSDDTDPKDYIEGYSAVLGATDIFEGLSKNKMSDLRDYDSSELADQWKIEPDFNITVSNSTNDLLRLGRPPFSKTTVHSKQYPVWVLDEYANQTMARINILLW